MNHVHEKTVCKTCASVILQCKCIDKDKKINYSYCDLCTSPAKYSEPVKKKEPVTTFEYMEAQIPHDHRLHASLNEHGSEGWELTSLDIEKGHVKCWFKREIPQVINVEVKSENPALMLRQFLEANGYVMADEEKGMLLDMANYCEEKICQK